jgi:TetR/AcrR family transcriptional repressor of nem operon
MLRQHIPGDALQISLQLQRAHGWIREQPEQDQQATCGPMGGGDARKNIPADRRRNREGPIPGYQLVGTLGAMDREITPQAARILDCAQGLITTGGYNGFSYADVSAQVGITKASIHHHFPTKSELVRVLVQRYRLAAVAGLAALDEKIANPLARLQAYATWWSACIGDGSMPICICAMLSAEIPSLPDEVALEVRLHFAHLAKWLENVLASGEAGKLLNLRGPVATEAQAFMATVHGAMLSARACGSPPLFKTILKSTLARLTAAP